MISSACAFQAFASPTHFIWSVAFNFSVAPAAFISCSIRMSRQSLPGKNRAFLSVTGCYTERVGNIAGLLCCLCFLNRPHKFATVALGILCNRPEYIENKVQNRTFVDAVLFGAEYANQRFAVIGADVLRNAYNCWYGGRTFSRRNQHNKTDRWAG